MRIRGTELPPVHEAPGGRRSMDVGMCHGLTLLKREGPSNGMWECPWEMRGKNAAWGTIR